MRAVTASDLSVANPAYRAEGQLSRHFTSPGYPEPVGVSPVGRPGRPRPPLRLAGRRNGGRGSDVHVARSAAVQGVLEFLLPFLAERGFEDGATVLAELVDGLVRGDLLHHEEERGGAGLQ